MSIFWIEKANVFHFEAQADFFSFAEATNAFRGKNQIPFFSRERAVQKRFFAELLANRNHGFEPLFHVVMVTSNGYRLRTNAAGNGTVQVGLVQGREAVFRQRNRRFKALEAKAIAIFGF